MVYYVDTPRSLQEVALLAKRHSLLKFVYTEHIDTTKQPSVVRIHEMFHFHFIWIHGMFKRISTQCPKLITWLSNATPTLTNNIGEKRRTYKNSNRLTDQPASFYWFSVTSGIIKSLSHVFSLRIYFNVFYSIRLFNLYDKFTYLRGLRGYVKTTY